MAIEQSLSSGANSGSESPSPLSLLLLLPLSDVLCTAMDLLEAVLLGRCSSCGDLGGLLRGSADFFFKQEPGVALCLFSEESRQNPEPQSRQRNLSLGPLCIAM